MSQPTDYRPLVWITDDSAMEAMYTQRSLGTGYDFELFNDGSAVIERLSKGGRQPDVLLLDWVMPSVSGDEVCRFLRSQPQTRDLPIIIVTASRIETRDVVEGLSIGANDYIPRPFVPEELRARVDNAIRAKQMREAAARERVRLAVIGKLGRAFIDIGPRPTAIVQALATNLIDGICDGCTITLITGALPGLTLARHRTRRDEQLLTTFSAMDPCSYVFASSAEARAKLPAAYHAAIDHFGMTALAVVPFPSGSPVTGVVTAMRDGHSVPFSEEDLVTIQTCLEYAAIAFENALRSEAERETRMQLQTILEHLPISILVADQAGSITHINQIALDHLPQLRTMRALSDLAAHVSLRTQTGEAIAPSETPMLRALRGEVTRGVELDLNVSERDTKIIRLSATPLRDLRNNVTSAIVAFDDITAERQAILERERAAEFQRYVLGIVSHDLRSPLQTLMMGAETIKLLSPDNAKVSVTLDRMGIATSRMQGIIEQLLDVVRTQLGGGIPLHPAEVNLGSIVVDVLDELTVAYPQAKFEPRLDNVRGMWDRERLAQVVTNLVGNAIIHGAPGSPVVIETKQIDDVAALRVCNASKVALTNEQQAVLFTPFRQTKRSGGSGLGLGLYIAREIVRAHQGDIAVTSNPETTTFTVRLPVSPPPAPLG
ncbi:MAG TPA: ATP-binding protein [Kofleriaceae bacterium]|nr:ATP-binding protein [Kofleriaceae bacterium]